MPLFKYKAINAEGQNIEGTLAASDKSQLIQILRGKNSLPIKINEESKYNWENQKMEIPITKMKNGESGVITSYKHHHNPAREHRHSMFEKRLTDMGLTPGTEITIVKSAPFDGPIELLVKGSRLAIGRGMAKRIFVDVKKWLIKN